MDKGYSERVGRLTDSHTTNFSIEISKTRSLQRVSITSLWWC